LEARNFGNAYLWAPATPLDDATLPRPTATLNATTVDTSGTVIATDAAAAAANLAADTSEANAATINAAALSTFTQVQSDASGALLQMRIQEARLKQELVDLKLALKRMSDQQTAESDAKLKSELDLRVQHALWEKQTREAVAKVKALELEVAAEQAKAAKMAPKKWDGMPVTADTTTLIIDELALKNASEVEIDAAYLNDAEKRVWLDKCLIAGGINDVEKYWHDLPSNSARIANLTTPIRRYIATVNAWLDKTGTTVAYICDSPKGLAIRREHLIIATLTNCPSSNLIGLPIENADAVKAAGSRMSATNNDIMDSRTLRRIIDYTDYLTEDTIVVPATDGRASSWAGPAAEKCMSYQGMLIVPQTEEQTTTVDEACVASEKATLLIEREIVRIDKLDVLFEKFNDYCAKTADGNSKTSTGALKERLEKLELKQKVSTAKANCVIVERKSQAGVLIADNKLKLIVDETNGKKNLPPDVLNTFPGRFS